MSEVKVNKVSPRSGTTVTIGDSGDTINIVGTLQNNGSPLAGDISSVVAGTGLSGGATSGVATLNIEAAQPTITSLGTITGFTSTGIDDNATSTAIQINSNEQVILYGGQVQANNNTSSITYSGGNNSNAGANLTLFGGSHASTPNVARFRSSATEVMRITSVGNVGIGTSSPDGKLQLVPTAVDTPIFSIRRQDHGSTNLFEFFQDSNMVGGTGGAHLTTNNRPFAISTDSSSTLGTGLFIDIFGKVGLGTSSPGQTLDVVGNAEINGNIYNNGKLNIRKDGASESEHLVITNETAGSNASPTFTDLHFNGYSGKDRGRIRVQDQSNNKVGGFMKIQTAGSESTDGSGFETRIFLDNDGDIFFYEDTGTTAKVKWDAINERFGIGTIAPTEALDVSGSINLTDSLKIDGSINFEATASSPSSESIYKPAPYSIAVNTNSAEMARFVDSRLLINSTTNVSSEYLLIKNNYTRSGMTIKSNTTAAHHAIEFHNPNNQVGSINTSGSSVVYNTSSDYRLKENVSYDFDATTRLKQLKPARFNFIADADKTVDGFLAHEVSDIVPEAISGTKDAVQVWKEGEELPEGVSVGDNKLDENGNTIPEYQGIDQSKLVPLLVKTIQELEARITQLENA